MGLLFILISLSDENWVGFIDINTIIDSAYGSNSISILSLIDSWSVLCGKKMHSLHLRSPVHQLMHKWLLGKQVISKKLCFYCWERVQTFHYKFLWLHGDTHTSRFLDFLSKRERVLLAGRWPLASGAGCRNSLSLII